LHFLGITPARGIIDAILDSDTDETCSCFNFNDEKLSREASIKIKLCQWASELGYDFDNKFQALHLSAYSNLIKLDVARVNGLATLKSSGTLIEELTGEDKDYLLRCCSGEVLKFILSYEKICDNSYPIRASLDSLVYGKDFKGLIRPNVCGCNDCDSKKLYLSFFDYQTHVSFTPSGLEVAKLTLENCPEPFVTDYSWMTLLNNVIYRKTRHTVWYKDVKPLFSEELRFILDKFSLTVEDYLNVLSVHKAYAPLNKKFGVRHMMRFTMVYNSWASKRGLSKVRSNVYNDLRVRKQADAILLEMENKVMPYRGQEDGIVYETNEEMMDAINSFVADGVLTEVELPPRREFPKSSSFVSEWYTNFMEKIEKWGKNSCLEKDSPAAMEALRKQAVENIEVYDKEYKVFENTEFVRDLEAKQTWYKTIPMDTEKKDQFYYDECLDYRKDRWEVVTQGKKEDYLQKERSDRFAKSFVTFHNIPKTVPAMVHEVACPKSKSKKQICRAPRTLRPSTSEMVAVLMHEKSIQAQNPRNSEGRLEREYNRSCNKMLLEAFGLKEGLKQKDNRLPIPTVRKVRKKFSGPSTEIMLPDIEEMERAKVFKSFVKFARMRFIKLANDRLRRVSYYRLTPEFKLIKYEQGFVPGDGDAEINILNDIRSELMKVISGERTQDFSEFSYPQTWEAYSNTKESPTIEPKQLFSSILKTFKTRIVQSIRNRKNQARILMTGDKALVKLVIAFAVGNSAYLSGAKLESPLRATEIRKIGSNLLAHEKSRKKGSTKGS
jgi:hypothetical protein